jgi:hypothetical protein
MKRTAQILKFNELKTMDDIREAGKALRSDLNNRRVTADEFRQIGNDLIGLLQTMNSLKEAKLKESYKTIQDLLSRHSPRRERT